MRIDVITEGQWIKYFWAFKIVETGHPGVEFRLRREPDTNNPPDVNLWVDWNVFLHFPKSKCLDVLYVTHIHENSPELHSRDMNLSFGRFFEADLFLHQSLRTIEQFEEIGFDPAKSFHLRNAIEADKFKPKITLGVIQNSGARGKGEFFFRELIYSTDLSAFKFILVGKDYEMITQIMKQHNVEFEWIQLSPEEYRNSETSKIYERLRYLLVLSLFEGGPVALQEAVACCVPIISARVGQAPEYPADYLFEPGDLNQLKTILITISTPKCPPVSFPAFNDLLFDLLSSVVKKK